MRPRLLGWFPLAALSAFALVACSKDGSDDAEPDAGPAATAPASTAQASLEQLNKRCEQLGRVCGDKDKHKDKIVEECKLAAKAQEEKGCTQTAVAAYDCYETEICAKINRVWSVDDFRVLTDRHSKCVAERDASERCLASTK